jgi:uncharacterized Zn-binding protein involved in type VI secretion
MQLPVKLSPPTTGVNANATTIPKHRIVGFGTPTSTNRQPIDALNVAGTTAIAGVVQSEVPSGEAGDVYNIPGDEYVLESDGSGTIAYGARVVAIAGATVALSGRVAALPGSPTAGTNYPVVGRSVSPETVAATAGAKVRVRWFPETYQG